MSDRGLIEQLVADGLSKDEATWAADKVLGAVATRVRAGRAIWIEGLGRLGSRTAVKDCFCEGPGKVDVKIAVIKNAVELSRGEPRRAVPK